MVLNTADSPINFRLCISGVFIKEEYRISSAGREMISFNRVDSERFESLTLEKGIPIEYTGIRISLLLFSIRTEASASVNILKCLVTVRRIDLWSKFLVEGSKKALERVLS